VSGWFDGVELAVWAGGLRVLPLSSLYFAILVVGVCFRCLMGSMALKRLRCGLLVAFLNGVLG